MGAGELLVAVAGAVGGLFGIRAGTEEPPYQLDRTMGAVEVRTYAPRLAAQTEVEGEKQAALNKGFSRIADYIFGANVSRSSIAMTAPVVQVPASQKIAMTAPVVQTEAGANRWSVRFIMPKQWTMETLPAPVDERVKLVTMPARRFAVIRFSGSAGQAALDAKTSELQEFVRARGMTPQGEPLFAFYNPPWTLPFFKRNEVMLEVAAAGQ